MPYPQSLEDLAQQILTPKPYKQPQPEEVTTPLTVGKAALDAIGATFKGAVVGPAKAAKDVVQGIGGSVMNAAQAFSPVPLPGATDPVFTPGKEPGLQLKERVGALSNAALFSLPDVMIQHKKEITEARPRPPKNFEDHFYDWMKAAAETAVMDVAPGNEVKQIFTGEKSPGVPMKAEDYGEATALGVLKLAPFAKGIGEIVGKSTRLGPEPEMVKKLQTIAQAQEALGTKAEASIPEAPARPKALAEAVVAKVPEAPLETPVEARTPGEVHIAEAPAEAATWGPVVERNMTPEQRSLFAVHGQLAIPDFQHIAQKVASTQIFKDLLGAKDAVGPEGAIRINDVLSQALQQGALDELGATSVDIARGLGVPIGDVAGLMSKVFKETSSRSGEQLKVLSDVSQAVMTKTMEAAQAGSPEAIELVRRIKEGNRISATEALEGSWSTKGRYLGQQWKDIENFRRGAMVSQLKTAARNARAQLLFTSAGTPGIFPMEIAENAVDGLVQTVRQEATRGLQIAKGETPTPRKWGEVFSDLGAQLETVVKIMSPEDTRLVADVLREMPFVKDKLYGQVVQETQTGYLSGLMKGAKGGVGDYAQALVEAMNAPNRMQESLAGRLFFRSRLDANLRKIGHSFGEEGTGFKDEISVPQGHVRLYRGEATLAGIPAPDWVTFSPEYTSIKDATGRWFSNDRAKAEWYMNEGQEKGKLFYKDVPRGELEKYKVANTPEAARYSADLENEFFLNKELADSKTAVKRNSWLLEELQKPEPSPDMINAYADAYEHSMKQTLKYMPEAGPLRDALTNYMKLPGSTAWFVPYPRFLINQFRWQIERAPSNIFNLLEPRFRKTFMKEDGSFIESANASRQLSRGIANIALLNGAYNIRQGPNAGPKYYQILRERDAQGNPEYIDVRSDQPFATYMLIADAMHKASTGKEMNLDAAEVLDATTGLRNTEEVPLLALPSIIRALNSEDPEVKKKAFSRPIGQYFASFFTGLHSLRELYGGVEGLVKGQPSDLNKMRDVQGQELTAPARLPIPGLAQTVPERVSGFTGKAIVETRPIEAATTGIKSDPLTRLQEITMKYGLKANDLFGNYDSADAANLVRKHTGEMLVKMNLFGDILDNSHLSDQMKGNRLKETILKVRDGAERLAEAERPDLFLEKHIRSKVPTRELQDKIVKEAYKSLGSIFEKGKQ